MMFESPQWLALLPLIVLACLFMAYRRHRVAALRLSSPGLHELEPTWRARSRWLAPVMEAAALLLLIVALAGPRQGMTPRRDPAEGIAIEMVIDRSGSMRRDDFRLDGEWVTRLTAVQNVAQRFVGGADRFPGRSSDLVGLLAFAGHAESECPLTLDHQYLLDRLAQLETVATYREDGTAVGDALGLAVARLDEYQRRAEQPSSVAKLNKVVILLTDGEHNAGRLAPLEAARLAAALDVRVYTIGVGLDQDNRVSAANSVLRAIAAWTDGEFYAASDTGTLEAIYAEIDRLERVRVGARTYTDWRHLAIEPFVWGPLAFPPFVLAALMLLVVQTVLESTFHRTVP